MCDALRELFAEELEEREHRGIEKGTEKKLIQLVCKKLWKKKTVEEIAEDLEEDNAVIARICETAEKYAPDYDCEQIYEELAGR